MAEHVCDTCGKTFEWAEQLRFHRTVAHGNVSDLSRRIETEYCPTCLMRFSSREQVLRHLEQNRICHFNVLKMDVLPDDVVAICMKQSCDLRGVHKKVGVWSGHADKPAIRMLGPYSVFNTDGARLVTKNGHPTCSKSRWLRPSYLDDGKDGSKQVMNSPCRASHFASCTSACLLCYGRGNNNMRFKTRGKFLLNAQAHVEADS